MVACHIHRNMENKVAQSFYELKIDFVLVILKLSVFRLCFSIEIEKKFIGIYTQLKYVCYFLILKLVSV